MIDEKTKIEYFDILLNSIEDIGDFNISRTLQKGFGIDVNKIEHDDLVWFNSLHDKIRNFGLAHKYFESTAFVTYRLTEKGIKAKELGGHLKYLKSIKKTPLTLFQKLQLSVTIISLITAIIFGVLNYLLSLEKADLKDDNSLLKSDVVRYKDSINAYKQKALLEKQVSLNDSLQTRNSGDLESETDLKN